MTRDTFHRLSQYANACMTDSAHDRPHTDRVLYNALLISREHSVNHDVLIAACLLHDIGREAQMRDPACCHARAGAEMARAYLNAEGWPSETAEHVCACIRTHRFRADDVPQSIEAKILFDADKLDAAGALGIARTLLYAGSVGHPLYCDALPAEDAPTSPGSVEESFVGEYQFKLKNVYDQFYTPQGRAMALERRGAARDFYIHLIHEMNAPAREGGRILDGVLNSLRCHSEQSEESRSCGDQDSSPAGSE